MSAGKTALGATWDSVTAIVSLHEGKEELYLILKDLLTRCSLSRKAAAIDLEKSNEIHMSLPSGYAILIFITIAELIINN